MHTAVPDVSKPVVNLTVLVGLQPIVDVWYHSAGAIRLNGWVLAERFERCPPHHCRCDWVANVMDSKPRSYSWSNVLVTGIYLVSNARWNVLMSPPFKVICSPLSLSSSGSAQQDLFAKYVFYCGTVYSSLNIMMTLFKQRWKKWFFLHAIVIHIEIPNNISHDSFVISY